MRAVTYRRMLCGSFITAAVPSVLAMPSRRKSYNFYVNLDDPEDTLNHVVEAKARLEQDGRASTTAYLHQELNEALALYQAKDFIQAKEKAEAVHQKASAHGTSKSLLFFTSKTAGFCCDALADAFEAHVKSKEETSSLLAPKPSAVFASKRAIEKFRSDAARYRGIALRIQSMPQLAFLRSVSTHSRKESDSEGAHADSSQSSSPVPCHWEEDFHCEDAEYEPFFGERFQNRRRRSNAQEQRHHLSRVCNRRRVPK